MQQEGEVALGPGRDGAVAVEAVVRIVGREVVAPVLQAEGRIGDYAVVGEQPPRRIDQARFGNDITSLQSARPAGRGAAG